jgi:hypothetical protein
MIVNARNGDPDRVAIGLASHGSWPNLRPAALWVFFLAPRPVLLSLSLSHSISLSLLNDKKKEEEQMEELSARRTKWERRRK